MPNDLSPEWVESVAREALITDAQAIAGGEHGSD